MPTAVEVLFAVPNLDQIKAAVLGLVPVFDRVAKAGKASIEASARSQVSAEKSAATQITRDATQAARDKERIAKESTRSQERQAREELRIRNAINQIEVRDWQQKEREKTREAESGARERQRVAENEAHAAEAIMRRRSRGFGSAIGNATGRVMGIAGRVAGIAGAIGGGFAIADSLRSGIEEEKTAGQLVRSSAETGGLTGKQVETSARAAATATGGKTEETLEGLDRFIRETGNLKAGVDLMQDLARYSAASGAAMTDLGQTSGIIFGHLGGDLNEVRATMLALIGQSKTGAIDIRNLAEYGGRLAGTAELFAGGTAANIETFGALAQIAKRKGGKIDAAEATESASRIFGEVSMHKDAFAALGVNVKGDGGKLRGVEDILLDTLVQTKGDITAIPKLFGRQAGGVETGLAQSFLAGSGGKTDAASLAAGRSAAAAEIQSFRLPTTEAHIDEDVKKRLAENEAKLNIATIQFHAALNEKLLPLLPGLIDRFSQLIPHIQRFLDILINNPLEGIGLVFGAAIGAEVAKAGIVALLTKTFTEAGALVMRLMRGGGGLGSGGGESSVLAPSPGGSRGMGLLGTATAALAITAAAVTITAAGITIIDAAFAKRTETDASVRAAITEGGNAEGAVRAGLPGSKEAAQAALSRLHQLDQGAENSKESPLETGIKGGIMAILGPLGGAAGLFDVGAKAISPFGGIKNTFEGAANFASAGAVGRSFGKIAEDEAAARAAGQVKEQLTALAAAVQTSTTSLQAFSDGMPKSPPTGNDPPGVPPPAWGHGGNP